MGALPAAATHGPPVVRGTTFQAYIDGPREVCKEVPTTYTANISTYYEFDDGHKRSVSNMGQDQGILNIESVGATTTVQTYPTSDTTLQITFPEAGTYELKAWGFRTTAGASDPVVPDSIQVVVRSCEFRIQQMSIWYHLAEGFTPFVGGLVDPIRFRLQPGTPQSAVNPLRTLALGKFSCPISFDVEDVDARFLVELTEPDNLHYYIQYTDGKAIVTISCPTPVGPIGANSREGPFNLDLIEGDVPVGPVCVLRCLWTYTGPIVSRQFPHVLHQQSDANGVTHVIVEPVE